MTDLNKRTPPQVTRGSKNTSNGRRKIPKGAALMALLLAFLVATLFAVIQALPRSVQDTQQLVGNWQGDSICQVKPSSCHDEKVVYHISKGGDPNDVVVSADKIVDGKAVNMGSGTYSYDKKTATLLNERDGWIWRLKVEGDRITGTLKKPDNTVFRRVTLERQN